MFFHTVEFCIGHDLYHISAGRDPVGSLLASRPIHIIQKENPAFCLSCAKVIFVIKIIGILFCSFPGLRPGGDDHGILFCSLGKVIYPTFQLYYLTVCKDSRLIEHTALSAI